MYGSVLRASYVTDCACVHAERAYRTNSARREQPRRIACVKTAVAPVAAQRTAPAPGINWVAAAPIAHGTVNGAVGGAVDGGTPSNVHPAFGCTRHLHLTPTGPPRQYAHPGL